MFNFTNRLITEMPRLKNCWACGTVFLAVQDFFLGGGTTSAKDKHFLGGLGGMLPQKI